MMKKVAFCASVSGAFTHKPRRARALQHTGLVHGAGRSMLEQMCANFRAATKRRHRQLCLQHVCVCVSISDTKMPNATLRFLMPQSNRVCVRETGGVRIDEGTRGGFSSWRPILLHAAGSERYTTI